MKLFITKNKVNDTNKYLELAQAFADDVASNDKGCHWMLVEKDKEQANQVNYYSLWDSKEDFDAHVSGASFQKHIPQLSPYYLGNEESMFDVLPVDRPDPMMGYFKMEKEKKKANQISMNKYAKPGQILFTGSSLMEQFPIEEMQHGLNLDKIIYNRGIGGYITDEFMANIGPMLLDLKPSKVFINIGTNDINESLAEDGNWLVRLVNNYDQILTTLKKELPEAEVYMMAYYPVNEPRIQSNPWARIGFGTRTNANVALANAEVEKLAQKHGYHFINVNEGLVDETGNQKDEFATDGVHMKPEAYAVILENLKKYL